MSNYRQLSQQERYMITALLRSRRMSHADIARELGRSTSTISRELARNRCHSDGAYRAEIAESYSTARRRRERRGPRCMASGWQQVVQLLQDKWSPEQISNSLRLAGVAVISHQTIYTYIWHDRKRGGTLWRNLRGANKKRRKHPNSEDSRGRLPGKRHISERPAEANGREEIGHWEADTVIGSDRHHCILTFVERKSGKAIIRKLSSRTAASVNAAVLTAIAEQPQKFKTITMDNGTEFHGYKELENCCAVQCYFATPYHSWERGSNENLNGLIRQYLPRGTCMRRVSQADCDYIAQQLNSRPRKRHGYRTPQEVYDHPDERCTSTLNSPSLVRPLLTRIERNGVRTCSVRTDSSASESLLA